MSLEEIRKYAAQQWEENERAADEILNETDPATQAASRSPTIGLKSIETGKAYGNTNTTLEGVERALKDRAREAHAYFEGNRIRGSQKATELIKGIEQGESPYDLLLTALECIGAMTGETELYQTQQNALRAIQTAIGAPEVVEDEIKRARAIIERLEASVKETATPREEKIIKGAIKAHKEKLTRLEAQI